MDKERLKAGLCRKYFLYYKTVQNNLTFKLSNATNLFNYPSSGGHATHDQ